MIATATLDENISQELRYGFPPTEGRGEVAMVRVELQTPIHEREAGTVRWEPLAALTVDGDGHQIEGDSSLLDLDLPVVSLRRGEQIRFTDDPEEWARSLVLAYRSGDLIATVVHDDMPVTEDELAGAAERAHGAAAV